MLLLLSSLVWPVWLLQNTRTSLLALASVPLRYIQFRNFHFFSVTCSHNALLQTYRYSNGCIYFIVFISMLLLGLYVSLPHLPWQIWKSGVSSLTKPKESWKEKRLSLIQQKSTPPTPQDQTRRWKAFWDVVAMLPSKHATLVFLGSDSESFSWVWKKKNKRDSFLTLKWVPFP